MAFISTRRTDIASSLVSYSKLTFATPAVAIQGTDVECRKVMVQPEAGKTVYVGDEDVDATYPALPAGFTTFDVSNPNTLYFFGTAGESVHILALE